MKKKRFFLSQLAEHPFLIQLIAWLLRGLITLLVWTLRIRVSGQQELQKATREGKAIMVAIWHNQLLLLAPLLKKILPKVAGSVLISKSRDGVIPTAYAKTYHLVDVIRVTHTHRHGALLETIDALKKNRVIIITPDGPKGPIYTVKPGVIYAAAKSSALVFPMHWHASHAIRCNSWDRFCIPLPFSKITLRFGSSLCFHEEEIAQGQKELQQAFKTLFELKI